MKRIYILVGLLSLAVCAHAQGGALLRMGGESVVNGISESALRAAALRAGTQASREFVQMQSMLHTPIVPEQLPEQTFIHERIEVYKAQKHYEDVIAQLNAFKKETDPLLYYQAKASERRTLQPQEVRQLVDKIHAFNVKFRALRNEGIVPESHLAQAYAYLNYVLKTVAPAAVPLTMPKESFKAPNRTYNQDEFFLRSPQLNCFQRTLRKMGVSCGPEPQLPENLDILIFNDSEDFIDAMQLWKQDGQLFPGMHVHLLHTADEVRNYILRLGNWPDLILSDMNTIDGIVGPALVLDLRENGFKGDILALSNFGEKQLSGQVLMDMGIDGYISRASNLAELTQAVKNYYYYRNLHNWQR